MLRLIHNRTIVKYVLAGVGVAIALYFAWSFYPFGEWAGKQFLSDVPNGPQILGIICACILGGLVLLLLFHKEYMREDVRAYAKGKDGSFEDALNMFVWIVVALEGFSILFRAIVINFSRLSWVIIGVGIVGMALTYIISKILHALVNRPASVEALRVMNDAENEVLGRARKDMDKLSSDDLRHVGKGNFNPLGKLTSLRENRRIQKAQEKEQEHMDWLAEQQKGQKAVEKFLDPNYSDPSHQNGHSKRSSPF